ncbi:MAG TPA: sortase [Mycobacteriales bacterium]|nr:sortase [Mycobacteriales bacterium]
MEPSFVTPALAGPGRGPLALLGDGLHRRGGRRAISVLSAALLLTGIGLFAYPLFTDLYQRHLQGGLRNQFAGPSTAEAYRRHAFKLGAGLTRLRIPKIGLDVLVVEGTTSAALRAGAGHYLGTPLPGEAGNVAIAGHRTTYGHPFNRLDEVSPGTEIELDTPTLVVIYRAVPTFDGKANPHPVLPTDVSVIAPPGTAGVHELTLTTCNPKGSASQRLILRAVQVSVTSRNGRPPSAGAVPPGDGAAPTAPPISALPAPQ